MLLGNNGAITNALEAIGINLPSIYGMSGIILVFSLKFFPFIYLMTENALNGINKSLEDAAENLGCSAWRRFRKVTLPLVFPAVSTGAIISFVLSIADFGTPGHNRSWGAHTVHHRLHAIYIGNGRHADYGSNHLNGDDSHLDASPPDSAPDVG